MLVSRNGDSRPEGERLYSQPRDAVSCLPPVRALLLFAVLAAPQAIASDPVLFPRVQPQAIEDGHARPRAVTVGKRDGLVYVAATTGNVVYVIEPDRAAVRAVLLV